MSDQIYNQLILVFDQKTNGIVCTANSDAHAAAIVLGMQNGRAMAFDKFLYVPPRWDQPDRYEYTFDYNDTRVHYRLLKGDFNTVLMVELLPSEFITEEWISSRAFTIQKARCLSEWEFYIRQQMSRVNDFYGLPNLMPFLTEQLSLCDPEKNYYTNAIIEWGEIQQVSPETAYQELKIRQEGYSLVYFRSHALYLRVAKNISMAKTLDDMNRQIHLGREYLRSNAYK
jgi:hypothetical protein